MRFGSKVLLATLALSFIGSTAWATEARLVGSWEVVRWVKKDKEGKPPAGLAVTMSFKKDHTWRGEVTFKGQKKKSETGTWTLKGDRLVTRSKTKPKGEVVRVKFEGSTLRLTKDGKPDALIFKRR